MGVAFGRWSNFDPAWRAAAGKVLARVAPTVQDPLAREHLRDGLRSLVRKHRNFAQADWALDEEDLVPLQAILDGMTAGSAAERRRWLFQTPDFLSMHSPYEEAAQLRSAQQEAAEDLLAELDDHSIIAFAETIRLRRDFGDAIGCSTVLEVRKRRLLAISLDLDGDVGAELSRGLLFGLSRGPGPPWLEALWGEGVTVRWSDRALVRMALEMPGDELTWTRLEAGPPSAKAAYWAAIPAFRVEKTAPLPIAAEHLIAAGRSRAAVWLLGHRIMEGPPADLLVKALMAAHRSRLVTKRTTSSCSAISLGSSWITLTGTPPYRKRRWQSWSGGTSLCLGTAHVHLGACRKRWQIIPSSSFSFYACCTGHRLKAARRNRSPGTGWSPRVSQAKPSTCSMNGAGCRERTRAAPSTEALSMHGSRPPGSSVRKKGERKPATIRSAISSPPRRGRGLQRGHRRPFGMRLSSVVAARSSADFSWGSSIDGGSPSGLRSPAATRSAIGLTISAIRPAALGPAGIKRRSFWTGSQTCTTPTPEIRTIGQNSGRRDGPILKSFPPVERNRSRRWRRRLSATTSPRRAQCLATAQSRGSVTGRTPDVKRTLRR